MSKAGMAVGLSLLCILMGCGKGQETAKAPTTVPTATSPYQNPRFGEVEKQLEPGGSLYVYMDVKDVLRNTITRIRAAMTESGAPAPVLAGVAVGDTVIDNLGLYGIEDFGMSHIQVDGIGRTTSFLRIPKREKGLLAFTGGEPHPFTSLVYAPSTTLFFANRDLDFKGLMDISRVLVEKSGGAAATVQMDKFLAQLSRNLGTEIDPLLQSLDNQILVLFTMNESRTMTLPGPKSVIIPEPNLALGLRARGATLYDALAGWLRNQGMALADKSDGALKRLDFEGESKQLFGFKPSLAFDGNYVFFASHGSWMDEILQAKVAGGGLNSASEFQKLTRGLPEQGNAMAFVSSHLAEIAGQVMEDLAITGEPGTRLDAQTRMFQVQMAVIKGMAVVQVNETEGIRGVAQREETPGASFLSSIIEPYLGMMSSVGATNFGNAQIRSKVTKVQADMQNLAMGLETYRVDYNQYPFAAAGASWDPVGSSPQDLSSGYLPNSLTTPIQYIISNYADPYNSSISVDPASPASFCYRYATTPSTCWIMASNGPDEDIDIPLEVFVEMGEGKCQCDISRLLTQFGGQYVQYDPTNGVISDGDIIRTGP